MIYTIYPYLATEQHFAELDKHGIGHKIEKIDVALNFEDLPRKYGRESETHRAMKKFAYEMLKQLGEPTPEYEYAYSDVFAPTLKIIIECGDTPLDKIYEDFFRWFAKDLNELWMFDYPQNGRSEIIKFFRKT